MGVDVIAPVLFNDNVKKIRGDSQIPEQRPARGLDNLFKPASAYRGAAWGARMVSVAHSRSIATSAEDGFVGVIYGDVGSTAFRCSVVSTVERQEFVQVHHDTCGIVLGRVEEVERKTDLSLDRAQHAVNGGGLDFAGKVAGR